MGKLSDAMLDCPYPYSPGFKEYSTSRDAAAKIAPTLSHRQREVLEALSRWGSMTPDEVADHLSRTVLAVRPRLSELKQLGLIEKTGERRANQSGLMAAVYRLTPNHGAI